MRKFNHLCAVITLFSYNSALAQSADDLKAARAMLYQGERNGGPCTGFRNPESCVYHPSKAPVGQAERYEVRSLAVALAAQRTSGSATHDNSAAIRKQALDDAKAAIAGLE